MPLRSGRRYPPPVPSDAPIQEALDDPAAAYDTPEAVAACPKLTPAQKARILVRWEADAIEQAIATDEGMAGRDPMLLHRIMICEDQVEAEAARNVDD